jgi:hypothetical protein
MQDLCVYCTYASKIGIKAIALKGPCFSSYGQFIECIQRELCGLENARFMRVLHVRMLAKLATTHVTVSTWLLGNVSPSVDDIVRRELSNLSPACVIFDGSFEKREKYKKSPPNYQRFTI